jgi:hypothetical protein
MRVVLVSRALSVCLVAALAALPLAPAEHVHQTDGPDGHHAVVAHAHLEDHHHRAVADDDHLATHVEDDDSVVLTFDRVFVGQSVHHVELAVEADSYLSPPAIVRAGVAARYQRRFIHGPPRAPTSLRAPPTTPSV